MKKNAVLKMIVGVFCFSFFLFPTCLFAGDRDSAQERVVYSDSPIDNGAFGYDVSVYGKRAAVLSLDAASEFGVSSGGQISLFEYKNDIWDQTETLRPYEGDPNGGKVNTIDIYENAFVGGAPYANTDVISRSGVAFVYTNTNGAWEQTATLKASDGVTNSQFGKAVAICNGHIIVGSPTAPIDGGSGAGAAYIFSKDGMGAWHQSAKLTSDDLTEGDWFGHAVDIVGTTAVVGAYQKDSFKGAAYVFTYDGTQWVQSAKLIDDHADAKYQGVSVAISDDENIIALGSIFDGRRSGQTGAVIAFELDGTNWMQKARLMAGDPEADDWLGLSVSISDKNILAGAYQASESVERAGAAYLFEYDEAVSDWQQSFVFESNNPTSYEWFGRPVAYQGNHILMGATKNSDMAEMGGAAYFFSLPSSTGNDDTCFISSVMGYLPF